MKLLIFVVVLIGAFTLGVLGVKVVKGCSVKNATLVCRDFVKEIISTLLKPTPPPVQYYPTIVGWDGYRIPLQLVDGEFSKVRENFVVCFCVGAGISADTNLAWYRFDIMRKPNSLDDEILLQLIQKQAEEALANTMRLYDYYLPTEPLTLVELYSTALYIAFARTEDGIKILDERKRKMRKRKLVAAHHDTFDSMTEDWEQKHE